MVATENSIYVSDKAKKKALQLMEEAGVAGDLLIFCALVWWVAVARD
jgi:hypothetical protein